MFVTLGGGGIKRGLVIGESDKTAEYPAERPIHVEEVAHTIYHALGIDPDTMFQSPDGRPIRLAESGYEPVHEIL